MGVQTSSSGQVFYALGPVIGDNGVVVFSSVTGVCPTVSAVSLIGIRERDGMVLWRDQSPSAIANLPYGVPTPLASWKPMTPSPSWIRLLAR